MSISLPYRSWRCALLVLAAALFAAPAAAQVEQGQFKLTMDTALVASERTVSTFSDDSKYSDSSLSFGPGGADIQGFTPGYFGLSFGYAALRYLVPTLRFSFARASFTSEWEAPDGTSEDDDGPTVGMWMLQPQLEIPFNPSDRIVVSASAGLDLRRSKVKWEGDEFSSDEEITVLGAGGLMGVNAHFFLLESAISLDLSAVLVADWINEEYDAPAEEQFETIEPDSQRFFSVGLVLGLSGWL